jgi:hypothetical protein
MANHVGRKPKKKKKVTSGRTATEGLKQCRGKISISES